MKFYSSSNRGRFIVVALLSFALLLLHGCGGVRKGITINSEPQGADILADGKNIGKTPMHIKQDDVFPPRWVGRSYMVKGQLEMQKEGCDGFKMEVNDLALSKDIKAELKCKPAVMQSKPQPAPAPVSGKSQDKKPAPVAASTSAPVSKKSSASAKSSAEDDGIEKRLSKLKSLRDRGVITAEEYSAQRKRILDSL